METEHKTRQGPRQIGTLSLDKGRKEVLLFIFAL